MKACGAVEHPRWHRQTLPLPVCRRTAPKHGHVAALDDFVNMHLAAKPGMPWIKNFPYLGPIGVVLLRCTIGKGCIRSWANDPNGVRGKLASPAKGAGGIMQALWEALHAGKVSSPISGFFPKIGPSRFHALSLASTSSSNALRM